MPAQVRRVPPPSQQVPAVMRPIVTTPPQDERIGEDIGDDRVSFVTFEDGAEYRVEDGKLVERVA